MPRKLTPELRQKIMSHPKLSCYLHATDSTTLWTKFKRWIFPGPIVGIIRLFMAVFFFVLHYLCQKLVFLGYHDWDKPAPTWRRVACQKVMRFWSQMVMIALGIYKFQIINHTANRPYSKQVRDLPSFNWQQQYPLVGNHMSLIDILSAGGFLGTPSFVSKAGLGNVPIVSFLLKAYRCILVSRKGDGDSLSEEKRDEIMHGHHNQSAGSVLRERITNPVKGDYAPLIFAEGTTNNGLCVTRFHSGCFVPGLPVRPFALSYPHRYCSLNFDSIETLPLLWDIVTQFYSSFRLEILDVYLPSEEEKNNPQLYADNVGAVIADTLHVPYRPDVDFRDKNILISLLDQHLTWEEAVEEEKALDAVKAKEKASHLEAKKTS